MTRHGSKWGGACNGSESGAHVGKYVEDSAGQDACASVHGWLKPVPSSFIEWEGEGKGGRGDERTRKRRRATCLCPIMCFGGYRKCGSGVRVLSTVLSHVDSVQSDIMSCMCT